MKTEQPRQTFELPDTAPRIITGWQPIDTAYTYENVGKKILIMNSRRNVIDATMLSGSLMTSMTDPTHWMPFPDPPN